MWRQSCSGRWCEKWTESGELGDLFRGGREGGSRGTPTHVVSEVSRVNAGQKPVFSDPGELGRRCLLFRRVLAQHCLQWGTEPWLPACLPPALGKLEAAFGLCSLVPQATNWLALTWKKNHLLLPLELETLPWLRLVQLILQCLFFKGEHRDLTFKPSLPKFTQQPWYPGLTAAASVPLDSRPFAWRRDLCCRRPLLRHLTCQVLVEKASVLKCHQSRETEENPALSVKGD